jgi:hypothetical protein
MTLAQEMADDVEADAPERDALVDAALCVGQWLADQGRPGRWDTVDPAEVLRLRSCATDHEAAGFLLSLAGLLGHAAFHGYVPVAAVQRNLQEIRGLSASPLVRNFVDQTTGHLQVALS